MTDLSAKIIRHFYGEKLSMSNPEYVYEMTILEHHLDTFGHVNNATYLELYEEARWDFITQNGMSLKDIMEKKQGPVVLDLNLTFKSELLNREKIKIVSVARKEMRNKYALVLDQKILKEGDKVASTLSLTVGMMDLEKRKLLSPTKEMLNALGVFEYVEP